MRQEPGEPVSAGCNKCKQWWIVMKAKWGKDEKKKKIKNFCIKTVPFNRHQESENVKLGFARIATHYTLHDIHVWILYISMKITIINKRIFSIRSFHSSFWNGKNSFNFLVFLLTNAESESEREREGYGARVKRSETGALSILMTEWLHVVKLN